MRVLLAVMLVGAALGAAHPTEALAQPAVSPAATTLAARLVDLTLPVDTIQAGARDAFASSFRESFMRDPRAQAAVERTPALLETTMQATRAKLDEVLTAMWPEMKASLTASYTAGMTPQELEAAVAFYAGPVGRKLVDATPRLATGSPISAVLDSTGLAQFAEFGRSPAGQKISALQAQQTRDVGEMVNRTLAAAAPQIEQAAKQAARDFLAANPG